MGETRFLTRLNQLEIVLLSFRILIEAVNCVFNYGVCVADAIQLVLAKRFSVFLTFDKKLSRIAKEEGLRTII